jgi:hypothetical protein
MPPPAQSTAPRHPGPPLLMPGGIFVALRIASFASLVIMTGFAPYPIPFNPGDGSRYFVEHAKAVQIAAFIQFGAAIPLGLFTATLASRLRFLGIEAAGVTIALFGGFAASFFLGCSALVQWVLAFPGVADDPPNARVLQLLAFATGGPGHVVPLGLLVAGASITAGLTRLIPRWLMFFGIALALVAELSTLVLILEPAAYFLPLARFPSFIWIICIALMLTSRRSLAVSRA